MGLFSHPQTQKPANNYLDGRDAWSAPCAIQATFYLLGMAKRPRAKTPGFQTVLRKEVIQPQVPLRLPCYDFPPVADLTVVGCFPKVSAPASGGTNSHGVTGGVYKARERIHRGMLIHDY